MKCLSWFTLPFGNFLISQIQNLKFQSVTVSKIVLSATLLVWFIIQALDQLRKCNHQINAANLGISKSLFLTLQLSIPGFYHPQEQNFETKRKIQDKILQKYFSSNSGSSSSQEQLLISCPFGQPVKRVTYIRIPVPRGCLNRSNKSKTNSRVKIIHFVFAVDVLKVCFKCGKMWYISERSQCSLVGVTENPKKNFIAIIQEPSA